MEKKQDSSRVDKERTNFKKEQLIPRVRHDREVRERQHNNNRLDLVILKVQRW